MTTIDRELARAILDAAARRGASVASFTGGEPLIFFGLLQDLVAYALSRGLVSEIVTNCFWARTPELAKKYVGTLHSIGLANLVVGYDDHHVAFLDRQFIKNAVHAAIANDVQVRVKIVRSKRNRITSASAARDLEIPEELLKGDRAPVQIGEQEAIRSGRAEDTFADNDVFRYPKRRFLGSGCDSVMCHPTLTPTGDLYACCGVGGTTNEGPARVALVGAATSQNIDQLYERMENNLILNLIREIGPVSLIERAKTFLKGGSIPSKYTNICDGCGQISRNLHLQQAIRRYLAYLTHNNKKGSETDTVHAN